MTPRHCLASLCVCSALSVPSLAAVAGAGQATAATSAPPARVAVTSDLFRHWVHSSEEELPGGQVRIFRPAESRTFPPSRFRLAYTFTGDGRCEVYVLAPDDSHQFRPCEWSTGASDTAVLRILEGGRTTSYRIVELSREILRLAPLEPSPGR